MEARSERGSRNMAVLNEGLQFRLLAGDLKNTGTILESVMRVRQYWDCGLIFGQVIPSL